MPIAIGLGTDDYPLAWNSSYESSVTPARSTGPAVFVGGWAISQLWFFLIAPIVAGVAGGGLYTLDFEQRPANSTEKPG